MAFCWVIDFPFFEPLDKNSGQGEKGWTFTHNPFSSAQPAHQDALLKKENIGEILAAQYDLALNGYEIGGGSIRNHTPEALRAVLEIMEYDEQRIKESCGHMLEAFKYGTPPHGGIAMGIDRLLAILANEPNIREVIAFPKTGDARDLMMDAPSPLAKSQLDEVGLELKDGKDIQ